MGILPHLATVSGGSILLDDPAAPDAPPSDLARLDRDGAAMLRLRGGRISIIFQEPMTSLSPLHTIGDQVSERSEEHTSELQSLMRISYAVFCLKKKKK